MNRNSATEAIVPPPLVTVGLYGRITLSMT
jgi:hypothetical protein